VLGCLSSRNEWGESSYFRPYELPFSAINNSLAGTTESRGVVSNLRKCAPSDVERIDRERVCYY